MRSTRSGFQAVLITVGILFLGACLFIQANFESAPVRGPQCVIAGLPLPLVMISTSDGVLRSVPALDDLARAPVLRISYLGSPYEGSSLDFAALKIYRQPSPEEYETMPSHVDLDRGCVISEVTESGLYIIA